MAYLASLTVSLTKLVGRIQGQSMYILIRSIHFFECINCSAKNDDNDSSGEFHCRNVLSIKPAPYAGSTLNNEYIGKNSPLGTGGKKRRGRGCIGHEGEAALAAYSTYLHLWPNRLARGGLDSLRVDRERGGSKTGPGRRRKSSLAICLLYYPSGKMRTTRSLVLSR